MVVVVSLSDGPASDAIGLVSVLEAIRPPKASEIADRTAKSTRKHVDWGRFRDPVCRVYSFVRHPLSMAASQPRNHLMDSSSLVLAIVAKAERVPGRTSLQKLSYFASDSLSLGVAFRPHLFGPFSDEVAASADVVVGSNLLREDVESGSFYRNGKERSWTRHTYSTTPDGVKFLDWLENQHKLPIGEIGGIVDRLKDSTGLDPDRLSILAKVHYVTHHSSGHRDHPSEISRKASLLGWKVSPVVARKALKDLAALRL